MTQKYDEWLKQAEYDLKAAEQMLQSNLPAHATFTIHLALEKLLKAYYVKLKGKTPPKTHSLLFFSGELPLNLTDDGQYLLEELEGVGIEARYPPDLDEILIRLSQSTVETILIRSKQVFAWIKRELIK